MRPTWDKVLLNNAARLRRDVALRASGERVVTHVPTGFTALDDKYGGVRIGVVTELMGHTGDGKSAFVRQCAEACAQSGGGALWVVGEDPEGATVERQFAGDTGLDTAQMGRLDLDQADLKRIDDAAQQAQPWGHRLLPVFETLDVDEILELVAATVDPSGPDFGVGGAPLRGLYLDYAQIFGATRNLEDDIARLTAGLHALSRDHGFATLIASQVTGERLKQGRDAWFQKRDPSQIRPSLGDTEWCRRMEKQSKAIWSVVRPGRWQQEWGENVEDDFAELHVIKNSFGPTGWVPLGWDGPTTRFLNP